MAKDNTIVINNFQKGIAPSSYFGFEEIRCLNTKDKPGVVYPNQELIDINSTGSAMAGKITYIVNDGGANFFAADEDDNIFEKTSTTAWTIRAGNSGTGGRGIIIWKDYLIAAGNTGLDAYGPLSGTPAWTLDFLDAGFGGSSIVPMVNAQNDNLYLGIGNTTTGYYVASIKEDGSFKPTTNTTWTENLTALDLPHDAEINCMAEYGSWLAIGTKKGTANVANIYLWDYSSPSIELPLIIGEKGVNQLISADNKLIIQAGDMGRFFVSDGTNVNPLAKIPQTMLGSIDANSHRLTFGNGAITTSKNKVFTGFSPNAGTSAIAAAGVYSIDVETGELALEYVTTEGDGSTNRIGVTALSDSTGDRIIVGWENKTPTPDESGLNTVSLTDTYSGDEAFVTSQMYQVGTKLRPKTFQEIHIDLAKKTVSGDSIKISYRTEQNGDWVAIKTFDTVDVQSFYTPFGKSLVTEIQFKIIINGAAELLAVSIK